MRRSKKHYIYIDLIKVVALIGVLLYHLNILKGGYLAVCIFFVISGYLACTSAFNKDKFPFKSYYLSRLKSIYLPLLMVVLITIAIISILPNISWLNLKPETTSVLLGYNNFWQLNANLDYFARHINSPFIHLWYISILLQFELVFPFLFLLLKKIGDKVHKIIPCIISSLFSLGFMSYFVISSFNQNIMGCYYNTFARLFSLLFGLTLGFIHCYYKPFINKKLKKKKYNQKIFYSYLAFILILLIFIDAKSKLFSVGMILTTVITCRLIDYAIILKKYPQKLDKVTRFLSKISYEIYLVQYPIIFFFQDIVLNTYLKIVIIITLTIFIAFLLHLSLNLKAKKLKPLKICLLIILSTISLYGGYRYLITKDYTKDMKKLENHLNNNEKIMQEKQKEYASIVKQEEEDWTQKLNELKENENKLGEIVTNLTVTGIGDSVMLGAIDNLYKTFPKGYFDAKVSRSPWVANGILQDLKSKKMLGSIVVINLGTNGDCSEACKKQIIETCENREIFWVNTTNDKDVHVNSKLDALAKKYSNVHVVDWNRISKNHKEYFVYDGIHLTGIGRKKYTEAIYQAIYNIYLEKYNKLKDEVIEKHENELKDKITFYGNDVLLNAFNDLHENDPKARFVIDKTFNYEKLKKKISKDLKENTITYKVLFAFDSQFELKKEEYNEIIEELNNHEIYILNMSEKTNEELKSINNKNVKIIDFYQEIKKNEDYLMPDKIHLTEKGNLALTKLIKEAKKSE